jgi:hypothetical protein
MKASPLVPPPLPDRAAPDFAWDPRSVHPSVRAQGALRDIAARQLRDREAEFIRREDVLWAQTASLITAVREDETPDAILGRVAVASAGPLEPEVDALVAALREIHGAQPRPIAEVAIVHQRACLQASLEASRVWLELLATDDAPTRMAHVFAIKQRNEERVKAIAAWEACVSAEKKGRELCDDVLRGLGVVPSADKYAETETPTAVRRAKIVIGARMRVAALAKLRAREIGYLEREAELLDAQVGLAKGDANIPVTLSRAEHLKALTPEMTRHLEELSAFLGEKPRPFAESTREHHVQCMRIATATAEAWLRALETEDEPRRMPHLVAIQAHHRARAQAILAWQTTVHSAKRRRYLLTLVREALYREAPELQDLSNEDVEMIDEEGTAKGLAEQPLPLPLFPPPPEFELPAELKEAFARKAEADERAARERSAAPEALARPSASDSAAPSPDRRSVPTRLPIAEPIVLGAEAGSGHAFYTGFAQNISGNGIFVGTFELGPKIGDVFVLEMEMPDGFQISVQAEVRWKRDFTPEQPDVMPGLGLRFIDLPPEMEERINAYIAQEGALFFEE